VDANTQLFFFFGRVGPRWFGLLTSGDPKRVFAAHSGGSRMRWRHQQDKAKFLGERLMA